MDLASAPRPIFGSKSYCRERILCIHTFREWAFSEWFIVPDAMNKSLAGVKVPAFNVADIRGLIRV